MSYFRYGSLSQLSNALKGRPPQLGDYSSSQASQLSCVSFSISLGKGFQLIEAPFSYLGKEPSTTERANNDSGPSVMKCFTFRELADATENFSAEYLVDVGSFGNVYRGKMEETEEIIAIEQLDRNGSRKNKDFIAHVMTLRCAEGIDQFLVHGYLPLGSLDQHLHNGSSRQIPPLDWYSRMKIALGTARALEYMHCKANPPVIYRNLKPSNILLDNYFDAKLSDFVLSKLGLTNGKRNLSARVGGTSGYIPPEYYETGLLTQKADVYCFGVVLLELVTEQRAVDITKPTKYQSLICWVHQILEKPKKLSKFADPDLQGNFPAKDFNEVLVVAAMCLHSKQTARPTTSDVVRAIMYLSSDNPTDNIKSPPPEE